MSTTSKAIYYTVSFNKVKSHYVTVKLDFEIKGKDFVDFKVPVWTPGSYKIREFSNAFENINALIIIYKLYQQKITITGY